MGMPKARLFVEMKVSAYSLVNDCSLLRNHPAVGTLSVNCDVLGVSKGVLEVLILFRSLTL